MALTPQLCLDKYIVMLLNLKTDNDCDSLFYLFYHNKDYWSRNKVGISVNDIFTLS